MHKRFCILPIHGLKMDKSWLILLSESQQATFNKMFSWLENPTENIAYLSVTKKIQKIVYTDGDKTLTIFFNLTQKEHKPENRKHFFEALEFRVNGKLDSPEDFPAYKVWNDDQTEWSTAFLETRCVN